MTQEMTVYSEGGGQMVRFDESMRTLIRKTLTKDATPEQFEMFLEVCQRTGLNPFAKQIYAVVRKGSGDRPPTMTIQTGIDGLRLIAQRTGEYEGQTEPQWCDAFGNWTDVWLDDEPPTAAKVGVRRRGFIEPVYGIAKYSSYVQMVDVWEGEGRSARRVGKKVNEMWTKMPDNQLAKCAEALALRKAFPQELSGLHTEAEARAGEYIEMSREQEEPRRIKPPKSKSQRAIEGEAVVGKSFVAAAAPVDEETGEIEDEEPIEGEVVEAPPEPDEAEQRLSQTATTKARAKVKAEPRAPRNDPPFGQEEEEEAPAADTWPHFYNQISEVMKPLGRNFGDLGMALNCPGNVVGVKEWWTASEGKIPDRYAYAHKALIGLE